MDISRAQARRVRIARHLRRLCARLAAMAEPDVILVADLHGRTGLQDQLLAVLGELAEGARGEHGCVSFRVLAAEEPGDFLLLASWASESALLEHYRTPHYLRYREQVGPMIARPSDVVVHRVSASVHALDPNPPDPGLLG
jgi:quinol monooxygenase YgiN